MLFPLPGGVINVAEKNDWYYMTALPHEFLFTKDHMVGAAFSKLDTVHWRDFSPVHLCDFEAQIHEEGGK